MKNGFVFIVLWIAKIRNSEDHFVITALCSGGAEVWRCSSPFGPSTQSYAPQGQRLSTLVWFSGSTGLRFCLKI